MLQVLVAFFDSRPGVVEEVLQIRRNQQYRIGWAVVEQGRCFLKEQRQVVFNATVSNAVRDVTVDPGFTRLPFESFPVSPSKQANSILIERDFSCRQDIK